MEMAEQVIQERHPGLVVFTADRYKQLFSFPETLTLESCGFKAGMSRIDKNLTTLPPGERFVLIEKNACSFLRPIQWDMEHLLLCSSAMALILLYLSMGMN